MKRLIPASILLLSVIAAYITGYIFISKTCEKAGRILTECEQEYLEKGNAEETAKKLSKYWEKQAIPLSFFVNHNRIDEIELEISSLKIYSKSENKSLFLEHVETLKMLLHQIKEDTKLSVHSVF